MLNRLFGRKQTVSEKDITIIEDPDLAEFEEEEESETEEYEEEDDESDIEEEGDEGEIRERVYAWGAEWAKTPGFEALPLEQKQESEFILDSFAQYMYTYQGVAPEAWNSDDMEECCLSVLPRKISAEDAYFRSIAPVLASFFRFLGETGRLRNASQLAARVEKLAPRIVKASQNPRNWGIAKSFAMNALTAGVDMNNEAEMNAFMLQYNARIAPQTDTLPNPDELESWAPPLEIPGIPYERPGPKVGRNDPCPCGSGKKYKKCCGNT